MDRRDAALVPRERPRPWRVRQSGWRRPHGHPVAHAMHLLRGRKGCPMTSKHVTVVVELALVSFAILCQACFNLYL